MVEGVISNFMALIHEALPNTAVLLVEVEDLRADRKKCHMEIGELIQQNFQILHAIEQITIVVGESHIMMFAASVPDQRRGEVRSILLQWQEFACRNS